MKFRFRLARVLKIKGIWEDQAKLKLASAVAAQEREQRLLNQKQTYWHQAFFHLSGVGLKPGRDLAHQYHLTHLARTDFDRQQLKVEAAQDKLATAQQEFLQRRADREVLSRLEEKKRAEFAQEVERKDCIRLDEIASISHLKRQRGL